MRPIRLTMRAFGSYGQKTEIDFTKPNQNLFLITGDTGAGKTTIFDAIVFALYGEASSGSNKKDGQELQSQFVDRGTSPFVELIFTEQTGDAAEAYIVRRVPRHVRPLQRGSGLKDEKESVSLILPDGTEYSQNTKETNAKLEEIVGLTKSQFMQVAMIAQGEFMELLRARSDTKKVIFRKLFNTGLFQSIVDELASRRKGKQTEIDQIRTVCQTEAGHIVIPAEDESAETLQAVQKRILAADKLSVTDMETLLTELDTLCARLRTARDQAQQDYDGAAKRRDEKRDACTNAETLLQFFRQQEQAEQDLAACSAAEADMRAAEQQIRDIGAALEIQAVHQRFLDAERAAAET